MRQTNYIFNSMEDYNIDNSYSPNRDVNGLSLCPFEPPYSLDAIPYSQNLLYSHPFSSSNGEDINDTQPVKVLVLCGAGLRGATILGMLEKIEKDTRKKIHELFDVVAGSSISGVAALAISQHISLQKIQLFYLNLLESGAMQPYFGMSVSLHKNEFKDSFSSYMLDTLNPCIKALFNSGNIVPEDSLLTESKNDPLVYIPITRPSDEHTILSITQGNEGLTIADAARLSMCHRQYFDRISDYYYCASEKVCNPTENVVSYLSQHPKYKDRKLIIVSLAAGRVSNEEYSILERQYQILSNEAPYDVLHNIHATQCLTREAHVRIRNWLSDTNAGNFVKYFYFDPSDQENDSKLQNSFRAPRDALQQLKYSAYSYLETKIKAKYKECIALLTQ